MSLLSCAWMGFRLIVEESMAGEGVGSGSTGGEAAEQQKDAEAGSGAEAGAQNGVVGEEAEEEEPKRASASG